MKHSVRGLVAACALLALISGCASQGSDGRESSITTYGTLDVGITRNSER